MRNNFDMQLELLHEELTKMGCLCEKAIALAVNSLCERDAKGLDQAISTDMEIDEKERDIEQLCMRLLMQQQPVARDLREISSALKMISDMERIGDQASDIADIAEFIISESAEDETHIRKMASEAVKMVTDSVDSFVRRDVELARSVIKYDDVVDKWFYDIKAELIRKIAADSKNGEYYVDLLMIAKYLERVGDHATNIAEWVEYSLTGEHRKYKQYSKETF